MLPLGSYDILIGMDWLEKHWSVINCKTKTTSNNVNFETGTINSKRELWPKNPKKTTKTVLKTKSVYSGMMFFFLGVNFVTVLKNGSDYEIFYKIFLQNIASERKC